MDAKRYAEVAVKTRAEGRFQRADKRGADRY